MIDNKKIKHTEYFFKKYRGTDASVPFLKKYHR